MSFRKTQTIEVIGIGSFQVMPIKAQEPNFKEVTQEGNQLKKVLVKKGIPIEYKWIDDKKQEYNKEQVFYDVFQNYVQQVKKTEKVKNFEIVDKAEIYNLSESSISILNCDETTKKIFEDKIKNNAIKFNLKKSSRGFSWKKAYIFKMMKVLVMVSGLGNIEKAIKEFDKNLKAEEQVDVILQKVEMKADELEIAI